MTDKNTKSEQQTRQNEQEAKIEGLPERPISETQAQSVKGGSYDIKKIVKLEP